MKVAELRAALKLVTGSDDVPSGISGAASMVTTPSPTAQASSFTGEGASPSSAAAGVASVQPPPTLVAELESQLQAARAVAEAASADRAALARQLTAVQHELTDMTVARDALAEVRDA